MTDSEHTSSNHVDTDNAEHVDTDIEETAHHGHVKGVYDEKRPTDLEELKAYVNSIDSQEPLLRENKNRFTISPITYPKLWEASGIGYSELIDRLIGLALERHAEKNKLRTKYWQNPSEEIGKSEIGRVLHLEIRNPRFENWTKASFNSKLRISDF